MRSAAFGGATGPRLDAAGGRASRHIGRSAGALMAGALVTVALTIATDAALHAAGLLPATGEPAADRVLLAATVYRTIYSVVGSYVVARLAPHRPMLHALVGGAIGLVTSVVGAVVTWDQALGPDWYPVALAVLALPSAWVGGKLGMHE
jgi:hypothetical protein